MTLVQVLMFFWILAPGSAIYVKGHSRAAEKARANIADLTCYNSASAPETSAATLHVDHIYNPNNRRSWLILVMTDNQRHVIYEKKAEEYPWPMPSTLDRMLRNLAKSTCPQLQNSALETLPRSKQRDPVVQPQIPVEALIQHDPK